MDDYEQIEITDLTQLPSDIKEMVERDARVMGKELIPEGCDDQTSWKALMNCMAIHKNQIETANERMDDLSKSMHQLAHTVVSFGSDFKKLCTELNKWQEEMGGGGDDDWWKRS